MPAEPRPDTMLVIHLSLIWLAERTHHIFAIEPLPHVIRRVKSKGRASFKISIEQERVL